MSTDPWTPLTAPAPGAPRRLALSTAAGAARRPVDDCALASAPVDPRPRALRLLVVDDNPSIRLLVRRLAQGWGYLCGEAPDGVAATRCVQCQPIALVLTDHDMPRLDGIALLHRLAARAAAAGEPMVPAILMSGDLSPDVIARAMEAGARAVLWKPLEPARLRALLEDLIPPGGSGAGGASA